MNITKSVIIVSLVSFLFLGCISDPKGANLELKKVDDPESGYPIYQLTFTENDMIVAKRYYQNGKTILSDRAIPIKLIDIINIEFIREDETVPYTNLKRLKEVIYSSDGNILARMKPKKDKIELVEGKIPDGIIVEKYKDSSIQSIIIRSKGTRNGPAISLFPSGDIKGEVVYKNGYTEGISRRYYRNGNLYIDSKMIDRKNIYHKEYFENGQLKSEIIYKEDGIKWAEYTEYDINGNVIEN